MRQITTALGAVFAAVLFAIVVPGSADAAIGWLSINGNTYSNPHGCYGVGHTNLTIVNHTNRTATVYTGRSCDHDIDRTIPAGRAVYTNTGYSVFIS